MKLFRQFVGVVNLQIAFDLSESSRKGNVIRIVRLVPFGHFGLVDHHAKASKLSVTHQLRQLIHEGASAITIEPFVFRANGWVSDLVGFPQVSLVQNDVVATPIFELQTVETRDQLVDVVILLEHAVIEAEQRVLGRGFPIGMAALIDIDDVFAEL